MPLRIVSLWPYDLEPVFGASDIPRVIYLGLLGMFLLGFSETNS